MIRLKEKYKKEIVPKLMAEFGIKNSMAVPKIVKVVVNMGVGEAAKNRDVLDKASRDMAVLTGQAPTVRKAKASYASFAIRRGMPVGLKVILRGQRMYDFLEKLFSIVLPRLRDFRGLSLKSFDKNANYTLGLAEHIVFPEIDLVKSGVRGLEVTIVTSTSDYNKSKRLLKLLGMPLEKG